MTKKQKKKQQERRRLENEQRKAAIAAERRAARRARVRPNRFWAPDGRSWLMARTLPDRAGRAAAELRKASVPVFEAKAVTRFVTSRGQQRTAEVAVLKRTLFVGVATLGDLVRIENCVWIAKVLSPHEGGIGWVDRTTFRPAWIESELFSGRHDMPVIGREAMQRFADHVTGHLKDDGLAPDAILGPMFELGVKVRVTDGAFATFPGIVEGYDAGKESYRVSVNIFGKSTNVDLAEEALEAA